MPRDNRSGDTQYAYAVSRVRAIEKKLLDKTKLDRMIDSKSPEEALKVLLEADYGFSTAEIGSIHEYERLLMEEHKKVYKLLKEIAPEPDVFDLFLLSSDYHNAKVILKAEFSGQDENGILVESGSIPVNRLKIMIKDRNMTEMPVIMRRAVEECIDTFGRTGDPQVIDLILDKASFSQMKEVSRASGNKFLKDLVTVLIDLANIKVFLRVKNLRKSWDFLQKILVPDGSIDNRVYVENLDAPLDNFIDALKFSQYGVFMEEGIESFKTTGSLTKFEKLSDNFIISFAKKAKYISFGIEPLIGYLMAKETEIKNARIVMVGKINNISSEIIRERLREAYV
ncbi:MAG: V-type ATP synthase subunit C [Bacillota bacterium]